MTFVPRPFESSRAPLLLHGVLAGLSILCSCSPLEPRIGVARGAPLSEDPETAQRLQRSLDGFLAPLLRGEFDGEHTEVDERQRHAFFYKSLIRGAEGATPVVLKSYPVEDGGHLITVAFVRGPADAVEIPRVVELEAVPREDGFVFRCPYERNTADMQRRTIHSVDYRFRGSFDEARAATFRSAKAVLDALAGGDQGRLRYDRFDSLEQLLEAHGLVYDASKCNFLQHDLGFLWDGGESFSTGTGDEAFVFGYARDVLAATAADADDVYWPWVNGAAAHYGGYGLSGDSVDVLARQLREELARRPDLDFLEEFRKGRRSSVQRHFSHFVICALLCRELVARHGDAAVVELVASGADGERFFDGVERLLGVGETELHDTVVRLIGAAG